MRRKGDRQRQDQADRRLRLQLQEHPQICVGPPLCDQFAIARVVAGLAGAHQDMPAQPQRPKRDQDRDHDLPRARPVSSESGTRLRL